MKNSTKEALAYLTAVALLGGILCILLFAVTFSVVSALKLTGVL